MKKMMILGLVTCSLNADANFPVGNISDFEGSYTEPSGKATASNWEYKGLSYKVPVEVSIEKQAGSLYFSIENDEFEFDQIPSSIEALQYIDWSGFSLKSDGDNFKVTLDSLLGNSVTSEESHSLDLKKLSVECSHLDSGEDRTVGQVFLDSCLNNFGKFKLGSVVTVESGKSESISNIDFSANQNKLNFKIKANGITVKGSGEVYFENNSVKIKINKAKAGLFSAKSKLFKEFKKQESDKFLVNKPWLEIILD